MTELTIQDEQENGDAQAANRMLAALSSLLVDRQTLAGKLGETFEGDRKVYKEAGYPTTITPEMYLNRYRRQPAARRIIDMPVRTTWRNPPDIVEHDNEDGTEFTDAWEGMVDRLGVWREFERADRLSRLGRFGLLLIGVADTDDSQLQEPLEAIRGPEDVIFLSSFSERHVQIRKWVDDPTVPEFGTPELYQVDLSSGTEGFQKTTSIVHRSRVLHIVEDPLEDDVFGVPALEPVFNDLLDLEKIGAGTAEGFWQNAARILFGNLGEDVDIGDAELDDMGDAFEEVAHKLRRHILTQGLEDLQWLDGSTPDPTGAADNVYKNLSAGSGIPLRMLRGSETGERSSTEDQKSFLGMVSEREDQHVGPKIIRAFIDRLVEFGGLPQPGSDGYEVQWPTRFETPEKDEAEIDHTRAQAAKELTAMGGDPLKLVEITEEGRVTLRPTGEREALTPEDLEPPEMAPPEPPPFGGGVEEGDEEE